MANPTKQPIAKAQVHSRAKAEAARLILEKLEDQLAECGPGSVSLLDDYHGNHKIIVDILNEVLP